MRTCPLRHGLAGLAVASLMLMSAGCKSGFSTPSMDWLSWGKKKPSMSTLATTTPQRPSSTSSTLPSPSTTMASSAAGNTGGGAPMSGSQPAGGGSGFYTGPYNTGPHSGNPQAAGSLGGPQAGGYAGAANTTANPGGSAYNGYQSPYNNPAGGYRTADNRSTYGMTSGTTPTNPYSGSAAPQPWNSAGNNAMGSGPVAPAGYGAPPTAPSQPAFGPGGSSPTAHTVVEYFRSRQFRLLGAGGGLLVPDQRYRFGRFEPAQRRLSTG